MKRNVFNILLLAAAAVVFSSCKDDDDDKASSSFTIDGVSTTLKGGALLYDGTPSESPVDGEDIYRHSIGLFGEGVTVEGSELAGSGNVIDFDVVSSSTDLEPGTYTYKASEENAAFDLWDGAAHYDWNTQEESEWAVTGGTLKVSKSGDTYTLDFDGVSDETVIKAHYTGTLTKVLKD